MPFVVLVAACLQFPSLFAEARQVHESESLACKLQRGSDDAKSIFHAAPEINRGRLFEVLGRTRHFADAETEVDALCQHLVVEDEVVGIFQQRQSDKDFAAEGAVAGVILGELYAQE